VALREQLAEKADWVAVSEPATVFPPTALRLVDSVSDLPAQTARTASRYLLAKRLLDITLSALLLALLAPFFIPVSIAIWLDSPGPVIFRQWRVGLDGKAFRILKFRTLTVTEDGESIAQVTERDARVTRIGHLLRRFSIDELPQLINVIRGDMSLVGPRPHAHAHDRYFAERIENYVLRHRMKPGITGWAQIHGLRGETATLADMRRRVVFDLSYVRQARFGLDLQILLATPRVVLGGRNAW
jgi:putative colanic acid biosysnthesis UDP-glucose lipid carrier transferase